MKWYVLRKKIKQLALVSLSYLTNKLFIKKEGVTIVSLLTGHGKSVLIQAGSNMKAAGEVKVINVFLNVFLAFYAKTTYSSGYYDND